MFFRNGNIGLQERGHACKGPFHSENHVNVSNRQLPGRAVSVAIGHVIYVIPAARNRSRQVPSVHSRFLM